MKWNRQTVLTVVMVLASVVFASLVAKHADSGDAGSSAQARPSAAAAIETGDTDPESGLSWVALTELPVEVQATVHLIEQGGPFPYDKDGSTFGNYEGLLPDHERGYYREYTVLTPGSSDRGARRIVTGQGDETYVTLDHYESFARVAT